LRANGSRECAPDDRLREAIHLAAKEMDCFVASFLAMMAARGWAKAHLRRPPPEGCIMSNESSLSLSELNDRIAILQDNIRQLVEQAAAASGEQNQERIADRINQQNDELEKLMKERDARLNK
jgi:uncharacterized small protein (DUF1192 family)